MINTSNQLLYQLEIVNKENLKVSNQMSTGKEIQKGSDNSILYHQIQNIENEISQYTNIETQINQSSIQNNTADSAVAEIKNQMESINSEVIKALNSGIDESSKEAISINIQSMEDRIFSLANTKSNDEYIFAGNSQDTKPFIKNADGSIDYVNSNDYQKVLVDKNSYQEQGINGFDLLYYTSDKANNSESLSFNDGDIILDDEGNEWKFIDHDNDGLIDKDIVYKNGDINSSLIHVSGSGTPIVYNLTNTQNTQLEVKSNYFDLLNKIENALENKDIDGNTISSDESTAILSDALDELNNAYDSINTSHSELGSKNKSFENYSTSTSAKITNLQIFYEETASADLTEAAVKAQSLEMTYSALYSTISKVNSLSLVNYI